MDRHDPQPSPGTTPPRPRMPLQRALDRFLSNPASGRNAILLITTATLATVLVGGVVIWVFDRKEFESPGEAFWYILQTVTTVGYGDVTPADPVGRFIGAAVMLLGIAFLSILTASITSSFIDARQAEGRARQDADEGAHRARLDARLDEVIERLDRIERLGRSGDRDDAGRQPG